MKPGTDKLLAKAEHALTVAQAALDSAAVDVAAGRAYYAMLHAARALLNERGLRPRAHAGVLEAFQRHLTDGKLDPRLYRWLLDAYDKRARLAEDDVPVDFEEAEQLIWQARIFVQAAAAYLRAGPPTHQPRPAGSG